MKSLCVFIGFTACLMMTIIVLANDEKLDDASGLFNERGWSKSSSVNIYGNAILNDFNGNLMYSKDLYDIKVSATGLHLNLDLNYNGSVGHTMCKYGPNPNVITRKYNFNSPEWVLSINGIAVQTFNFETDIWSLGQGLGGYYSSDSIDALINGYFFTASFPESNDYFDIINILMGDGSVSTFQNYVEYNVNGTYGPTRKGSSTKLFVVGGRLGRTIYMKKGDGLTYIFEEYWPRFYDYLYNVHPWPDPEWSEEVLKGFYDDNPRCLLLKRIVDRTGAIIELTYNDSDTIPGHPLLENIILPSKDTLTLGWEELGGERMKGLYLGFGGYSYDYYIAIGGYLSQDTGMSPSLNANEDNRGFVLRLVEKDKRTTAFHYTLYKRHIKIYYDAQTTDTIDITSPRVHEILTPEGGTTCFTYYRDSLSTVPPIGEYFETTTLEIYPLDGLYTHTPRIKSIYFDSIGRDPFYINIVTALRKINKTRLDTSTIAFDTILYSWVDNRTTGRIDIEDTMITKRYPGWVTHYGLPEQQFVYSYFPYLDTAVSSNDIGWDIKLLEESRTIGYLDTTLHPIFLDTVIGLSGGYDSTISYNYNIGTCDSGANGFICDGTFLIDSAIYEVGGESYVYSNSRTFAGDIDSDTTINIINSSVASPLGLNDTTFYFSDFLGVDDSLDLYLVNLASKIISRDTSGQLIYQDSSIYYTTDGTDGWRGQLKERHKHMIDNGLPYDTTKSAFTYYDTVLSSTWRIPPGQLKKQISPEGDSAKYFYRDYDATEQLHNPVLYFLHHNDGTVDTLLVSFENNHFVNWYKRDNYLGSDTLRVFQDLEGPHDLLKISVDKNKHATLYDYDPLRRIRYITMPYDYTLDTVVIYPDLDARHLYNINQSEEPCDSNRITLCSDDSIFITKQPCISPDTFNCNMILKFDEEDIHEAVCEAYLRFSVCYVNQDTVFLFLHSVAEGWSCPWAAYFKPGLPIDSIAITDTGQYTMDVSEWLGSSNRINGLELRINNSEDTVIVATIDHTNTSIHPQLALMGYLYGGYTYRYIYDDDITDNNGARVTHIKKTTNDTSDVIISRFNFDGYGRNYQTDFFSSASSYDSIQYYFDRFDKQRRVTDQHGHSTETKVLTFGQPKKITYPDSNESEMEFFYFHNTLLESLPAYPYDTLVYNFLRRICVQDENDNQLIKYYDLNNSLLAVVNDTCNSQGTYYHYAHTYYDYDDLGRVVKLKKPSGIEYAYQYNTQGWKTKEWSPDYDTVWYIYNDDGNLIAEKDGVLAARDSLAQQMLVESIEIEATAKYSTESMLLFDTTIATAPGTIYYSIQIKCGCEPYYFGESHIYLNSIEISHVYHDTCSDSSNFAVNYGDTVVIKSFAKCFLEPDPPIDFWASARAHFYTSPVYSFWKYWEYDEVGNVTETGLLYGIEEYEGNALQITDTVSKTAVIKNYFNQKNSTNSQGRLSLTYSDNSYSYGESYNYDARGRLINQTDYYTATLDSTLSDSVVVIRDKEQGKDSAIMVVEKDCYVRYRIERCPSAYDTYGAITKNDTIIDYSYYPPACDTIVDSLLCTAGDVIKLYVYIDIFDENYAKVRVIASYTKYDSYQYYLTGMYEYEVEYSYNQADQLTSTTYPSGMVVTYSYDDKGRLEAVGDTADSDRYAYFTYTARDEVETLILGGLDKDSIQTIDYAYNARGWLNSINNGSSTISAPGDLFGQRLYYYGYPDRTWDEYYNGNIMAQDLAFGDTAANISYRFLYDDLDRLTEVATFKGLMNPLSDSLYEGFTYDANGNLLKRYIGRNLMGPVYYDSLNYTYYSGTNRVQRVRVTSDTAYLYDENGNLSYDSVKGIELHYDIYNQLDTALFDDSPDSHYIVFGYSPGGLRIRKGYHYTYWDSCDGGGVGDGMNGGDWENDSGGDGYLDGGGDSLCLYTAQQLTRYVRGKLTDQILAEYNNDQPNPCKFKYIYAGDQRIAMYDELGNLHFYLNDHLGSARIVIDTAGTIKDKHSRYYAFGASASQTVSTNQAYRYTGKPFDDEGTFDLYYYGARYYDPVLGRFITIDPRLEKFPSWSPYTYALDNPLKLVDPNGQEPVKSQMAKNYATAVSYFNLWNPINYAFGESAKNRYIPLKNGAVIDMLHFSAAAVGTYNLSRVMGKFGIKNGDIPASVLIQSAGLGLEIFQLRMDAEGTWTRQARSAFDPEDIPSNIRASIFIYNLEDGQTVNEQLIEYLKALGAITLEEFIELYPDIWKNMAKDNKDADRRYNEDWEREETFKLSVED
jgi:RHS repeat-associated protein